MHRQLHVTAASALIHVRTAAASTATRTNPPPSIPTTQEDIPAEGKWDSNQWDIIQDLLTLKHSRVHKSSVCTHTEQGSGTRTSGLGFSRLCKTPETGRCVRRMCRSVCLIIIAYIEADDSSIMPNGTETAGTNAETVHRVLNTARAHCFRCFDRTYNAKTVITTDIWCKNSAKRQPLS